MKATELASMFVSVCLSVYLHTGVCLAAVLTGSDKIFQLSIWEAVKKLSVFGTNWGKVPIKTLFALWGSRRQ